MSQSSAAGEARQTLFANRRGALGTLGFGALAFLGSGSSLFAAEEAKSGQPKVIIPTSGSPTANRAPAIVGGALPLDLSKLPEEWVLRQGNELRVYVSYLIACKLQRITPQLVIEAHAKRHGEVWNTLPPRNLWRQIVPTLRVVDRLSMELGQPVGEIVSAYRSPVYNSTCEGAKSRSWHQANVALDVKFAAEPSTVATTARSMRTRGLYRGGVGRYGTFTHIDTRGENVDW
jgi:hypothetical protein